MTDYNWYKIASFETTGTEINGNVALLIFCNFNHYYATLVIGSRGTYYYSAEVQNNYGINLNYIRICYNNDKTSVSVLLYQPGGYNGYNVKLLYNSKRVGSNNENGVDLYESVIDDPSNYDCYINPTNATSQNLLSYSNITDKPDTNKIFSSSTSDTIYFIGVTSSSDSTSTAYKISNAMYYGNTTGIFFTSDKRRKHDISYITKQDTELFFSHKYFKHFFWNHNDKSSYGVIAQEIEKWCPEAVNHNEESGYLAVNYQIVHSKAIAVMEDKINALEEQIKELQKLIK